MYTLNDKIVIFDTNTLLPTGTIDWPWPETMLDHYDQNNIPYIIASNPNLLNSWVNGDHLEPRELTSITFSSNEVINDGVDYLTISNLPYPSKLSANGVIYNVTSNTLNFTTTQSGPIWVELVGKYSSNGTQITAKSLNTFKDDEWEKVKATRDEKINGGYTVPNFGNFQTDLVSRTNINGAVTAALIANINSQPFSVDWKLTDNTSITLDAAQMILVGTTIANYISALYNYSETLRTNIYNATSLTELHNIQQFWPI